MRYVSISQPRLPRVGSAKKRHRYGKGHKKAAGCSTWGLLAKESRPDPNAKKPSMPRARVLVAVARNLDKAEKPEGAIVFYRQVVMECRGTPESDQAIVRLKALGGKVPELAESIPPKEGDPYVPPKGVKHHYASSKAAGEVFDRMMSQAMQSVMKVTAKAASQGCPDVWADIFAVLQPLTERLAGTPSRALATVIFTASSCPVRLAFHVRCLSLCPKWPRIYYPCAFRRSIA
jgi:hypothetical protein